MTKKKRYAVWILTLILILQSFSSFFVGRVAATNMMDDLDGLGDVAVKREVTPSSGNGDYEIQWLFTNTAAPEEGSAGQDIVLVVDRSRAWDAEDEVALETYIQGVTASPNTRLGLVSFGTEVLDGDGYSVEIDGVQQVLYEPEGVVDLTTDTASLLEGLAASSESSDAMTNALRGRFTQSGLRRASEMLAGSENGKIILLTRGAPTYSWFVEAVEPNENAPEAIDLATNTVEAYLPSSFTDDVLGNGSGLNLDPADPRLDGAGAYTIPAQDGGSLRIHDHASPLQGEAAQIRKEGIDLEVIAYDLTTETFVSSGQQIDRGTAERVLKGLVQNSDEAYYQVDTPQDLQWALEQTKDASADSVEKSLTFYDAFNSGVIIAEGTAPQLYSNIRGTEGLPAVGTDGNSVSASNFTIAPGETLSLTYDVSIDADMWGGADAALSVSTSLSDESGQSAAYASPVVTPPTPQLGSVIVRYIDTNGNLIQDANGQMEYYLAQEQAMGTPYDASPSEIPGYNYVGLAPDSAPASGTIEQDVTYVIFQYQEAPTVGSVYAYFIDENAQPIANADGQTSVPVVENASFDTVYNFDPPAIDGYEFVGLSDQSAELSGTVNQELTEIYLVYRIAPKTGTVYAEYRDTDGATIYDTQVVADNVPVGEEYTASQLAIDGYQYARMDDDSAPQSGVVQEGEQTVIFIYEKLPTTGSVYAYFIDENAQPIANAEGQTSVPVLEDAEFGVVYNYEAPQIDGYEFVGLSDQSAELSGTVNQELTEIYLVYRVAPKTGTVYAEYRDTNGETIYGTQIVADNVPVGQEYTASQLAIDGYQYVRMRDDSAAQSGEVQEGKQTVIFIYEKLPTTGSVYAYFIDENGQPIKNADEKTSVTVLEDKEFGVVYNYEPPAIDGYEFVGLSDQSAELSGTVDQELTEIYLVYRFAPKTGTVYVRYVDQEGNDIVERETLLADEKVGTTYEAQPKSIEGYEDPQLSEDSAAQSGEVQEGKQTVIFVYKPVPKTGSVIAYFIDQNGQPIENADEKTSVTVLEDANFGNVYNYEAPKIDGYEFVGLSDQSAELSGTVDQELTEIYLVYRIVPKKGTVYVRYIDQEGNDIVERETLLADENVGTTYEAQPKMIEGYQDPQLSEDSAPQSGEVKEGEQTVIFVYKPVPKTGSVYVRYIDQDGKDLLEQETVLENEKVGTTYDVQPKSIEGYEDPQLTENSAPQSGKIQEGEQMVIFVYKPVPKTGSVVVYFIDENREAIKNNEGQTSVTLLEDEEYGTGYDFNPPEIDGYEYVGKLRNSAALSGKVEQELTKLYVVYRAIPKTGTVYAKYIDTESNEIHETEVVADNVDVGTEYTALQLKIDGYDYVRMGNGSAPQSGEVKEGEQTVIFVYEMKTGSVHVRYIDQDGKDLLEQETVLENENVGTTYDVQLKTIEGYEDPQLAENSAPQSGEVKEGEQTVIFVYKPVPKTGSVYVRYIDQDGKDLLEQETVLANENVGTTYDVQPKSIEGYENPQLAENSAPQSGEVKEGEQTVIFVYKMKKGTVIAYFVDEDGEAIAAEDKQTSLTVLDDEGYGTEYNVDPPEIEGYEYVGLQDGSAKLSGTVEQEMTKIYLVYQAIPKTGSVIVYYKDSDGNDIADPVTVYEDVEVGEDYSVQAKAIDGFTYEGLADDSKPAEGKVAEGQNIITFVYKAEPKTGSVIVYYKVKGGKNIEDPVTYVEDAEVGEHYKLSPKQIEGYEYLQPSDNSAPLEGEIKEGKQYVYLIYRKLPETGTITVKYEDPAGNTIHPEEVKIEDEVGTAYKIEIPEIEGYEFKNLKNGSRPLSGEVQPGDQAVILVYSKILPPDETTTTEVTEPKLGTVLIRFEDTSGLELRDPQVVLEDKEVGTDYEISPPEFEDYKFSHLKNGSRPAKGSVIEGENVITFVYEPKEEPKFGTLILRFEDEEGLEIKPATTLLENQAVGTKYKVTPAKIKGFEYDGLKNGSAPLEGELREGDNIVTAIYRKTEDAKLGSVYVRYYNEKDEEIRDPDTLVHEAPYTTTYNAVPPILEGYEYKGLRNGSAPAQGEINKEDITVSFVYKKTQKLGSVQVSFIDPQNNSIREDLVVLKDQPVGSLYAVQLPHVAGYTFSSLKQGSPPLTGTIQEGTTTITAVYRKEVKDERGGLVINYLDQDGNPIKDSQRLLQNARVGTPYLTTIPAVEGYAFKGMAPGSAPPQGNIKEGENTITFVYEKTKDGESKTGNVIVHYVDELGRPIIEDLLLVKDKPVGTKYLATAPAINGYEFLRVQVGGAAPEGEVKEGDQHVTFIYRTVGTAASGEAPVPQTGENLSPILWVGVALLVLAIVLLVVRIIVKRKDD